MWSRCLRRSSCRLAAIAVSGSVFAHQVLCDTAAPASASVGTASSAGLESIISRVAQLEKAVLRSSSNGPPMVVISPTFYPSLSDTRCQLGLESCRRAKALGIPVLLVDASPAEVKAAFKETGAIVHEQTRAGRKGAALRECVEIALTMLPNHGIICYQVSYDG